MAVKKVIHKFKPKQMMIGKLPGKPPLAGIPLQDATPPPPPPPPPPARELPSAMLVTTPPAPKPVVGAPLPGGSNTSPKIHRLNQLHQRERTTIIREQKTLELPLPEPDEEHLHGKVEELRDQLQNYLELCDSIANDTWTAKDIVDVLHMLVRSLSLDVVSIVLLDPEHPGELGTVVSRGYRLPPGGEMRDCWQQAVNPEGQGLSWQKLMAISSDDAGAMSAWLAHENLHSYGYVPIRDNHRIHGFLLIGAHEKKETSPLASGLLELAGGRMGLSLALRSAKGVMPDAARQGVREIRDQYSIILGCFESIRELAKDEACRSLLEQCDAALQESTRLLDQIAADQH